MKHTSSYLSTLSVPGIGWLPSTLRFFLVLVACCAPAASQTTAFTYQGRLADNGNPATDHYDFEFRLFDLQSGGTQQGSTLTLPNILVTNGVFTVQLDFIACATCVPCPACFNGLDRFLDISVRLTGGGSFTHLTPRQPLTPNPYAIKSRSALSADGLSVACLSCVTSSQIASVNGSAVTGTIPVASFPPGSGNYIQNTTSPQAASNFNISGNGSADVFNATTQFNIGSNRILSNAGNDNLFAGQRAGEVNTGSFNAFFGRDAGRFNTSGSSNSFFGSDAGFNNDDGGNNTFIGTSAGFNSFGSLASGNTFVGVSSGGGNTTGRGNTMIGFSADLPVGGGVINASAIGSRAFVTQSNSLVLGSINGVNNALADTNVGIGTTAPSQRLHVVGNGLFTGNLTVNGTLNATLPAGNTNYIQNTTSQQAASNFSISGNGIIGGRMGLGTAAPGYKLEILDPSSAGLRVETQTAGGTVASFASNGEFQIDAPFDPGGRFVVKENGNVGIGRNNPLEKFHLSGKGNVRARLNSNSDSSGLAQSWFSLALNEQPAWSLATTNALGTPILELINHSLFPQGLDAVVIEGATNNIGIGDLNPDPFKLSVSAFFTQSAGLRVFGATGTVAQFGTGEFQIGTDSTPGNRLIVKPSGNVGIGTLTPQQTLHVHGLEVLSTGPSSGFKFRDRGSTSSNDDWVWYSSGNIARFFRADTAAQGGDLIRINTTGVVTIFASGAAGNRQMCRNSFLEISDCSSSIRYKQNINAFASGLSLVNRLRPVSFNWKADNQADVGLIAEEVAKVEPLLVTHNDKGEIEGVKYDRIAVVLINVVKEQQQLLRQQQQQIDALRKLICSSRRRTKGCR